MADKKDPKLSPNQTGGPVVKNGPNGGQNRARNKDGQWRAKRDDAGKPRKRSGCFLTSAACDYRGLADDCKELVVLRRFRDDVLLATEDGRRLVDEYYAIAPPLASNLTADQSVLVWHAIESCVSLIEAGRLSDATTTYQLMVKCLQRHQPVGAR